jgi:hypothetical protein
MKYLQLIILLLISQFLIGQPLKNVESYLKRPDISQTAKDCYLGKFMPIDDERTFSVFDSLETKNSITRPFYLLTVSKILVRADGALSEAAGVYCKKYIETDPNHLITFLYTNNFTKNYIKYWANQISMELSISCENYCKSCSISSLEIASKKISSSNSGKLQYLYTQIQKNCP